VVYAGALIGFFDRKLVGVDNRRAWLKRQLSGHKSEAFEHPDGASVCWAKYSQLVLQTIARKATPLYPENAVIVGRGRHDFIIGSVCRAAECVAI
jgi:hypothetical protein